MRCRILRVLQAGGAPSFPREMAEAMDEPLSNVSYHCRILYECGAVKLVDEKPARGAMTHIYAFSVTEDWALAYLSGEAGTAA